MTTSSMPFDTLDYVNKMKQVGFTEAQAELQAKTLSKVVHDQLATKQDIKELKLATQQDIKDLKKDMDSRFAQMESKFEKMEMRVIFKLASVNVIVIGLFAGLFGILMK